MKKKLRKYILNTLGLIIFGLIAFITIIIARGNRIDFNTGKVVETGSIVISSQPNDDDVKVFLNEQERKLQEKRLEGVDPGEYKLRVQHAGYTSWEGTVEVKPGFNTAVSVTLFPTNQKLEKVSQTNINKAVFDSSRNSVVYLVNSNPIGSEVGIWRRALTENFITLPNTNSLQKITNITDKLSYLNDKDYKLILSPDGSKLWVSKSDFSSAFILDTNRFNEPTTDSAIKFDYPIDKVYFLNNNIIVIAAGDLLVEYNTDNKLSTLLYYHPTIAPIYAVDTNAVYWLDSDHQRIFTRSGGATKQIVLENIKLPANPNKLFVAANGNIVAISNDTGLTFIQTANSYIKEFPNQTAISVSPNGQYIIAHAKGSDKLDFVVTDISQVFNNISHRIVESELKTDSFNFDNLQWSLDSSFFIIADTDKNILALDNKGQNKFTLIANEANRINNLEFSLTNNNKALIANLQDGLNDSQRFNIYKFDFQNRD